MTILVDSLPTVKDCKSVSVASLGTIAHVSSSTALDRPEELSLASLGFPQETASLSKTNQDNCKSTKLQTKKSLIALNFFDQGK